MRNERHVGSPFRSGVFVAGLLLERLSRSSSDLCGVSESNTAVDGTNDRRAFKPSVESQKYRLR